MSLYLLGISRSRDLPHMGEPPAAGPFPVRWILAPKLAAAVVDAPQGRAKPLQHAAALDAIHRRICVLPMRFGTVFRHETEINAVLETRHLDLLRRLDRLDGACEMGLRIALPKRPPAQTEPPTRTSPSASYLNQRRAYYQRRDSLGEQARVTVECLVRQLGAACRDWRRLTPSPPGLVRLAFLVDRRDVGRFKKCLRASIGAHAKQPSTLLGPWPPYSFV